jgi:hypothetical protein
MSSLDPAVVKTLPARVCVRAQAIAVRRSERGLDVAFVDPADEAAVRDVRKAAGDTPVVVTVTAEPLVWYAIRVHGLSTKIPKHLEAMVDELVSAGLSSAPKRMPVPAGHEEPRTTPLGGVAPSAPDERTTASLIESITASDPEIAGTPDEIWERTEKALDAAKGLTEIAAALLAFAKTGSAAAAVLRRFDDGFEPVASTGLLEGKRYAIPAAKPTVLTAALAGETGFRGAVPGGSAALPIFEGRTQREVLLLALRRNKGDEALLYAEVADAPFDAAFVERLRVPAAPGRHWSRGPKARAP